MSIISPLIFQNGGKQLLRYQNGYLRDSACFIWTRMRNRKKCHESSQHLLFKNTNLFMQENVFIAGVIFKLLE
jgi:hypothetical protein